jgi:hypothetical protein
MLFSSNNISYENFSRNLNTGDIVLYQSKNWYSRLIEYFTNSPYSLVSMILKKPNWLNEDYYIIESGGEACPDTVSDKKIFGVQIIPLKTVYEQYKARCGIYVRKLESEMKENVLKDKRRECYKLIKDKPYDTHPLDWIKAYIDLDKNLDEIKDEERVDCFWCSALISFIYCYCGFLGRDIPWSIVAPSDFSCTGKRLKFMDCVLREDERT